MNRTTRRRSISRRTIPNLLRALGVMLALLLVISVAPPARPASAGPALSRLRLGVASTPVALLPNSVLWLAKDLGFYEREGLDVDVVEVQGTPLILTAMRTGDLDVGNIATEEAIRLTATKGLEMRAIHSPDTRLYFLIAARSDIGALTDLRGRTFAVARVGSLDYSLTELVLQANGMDINELRIVAVGAPAVRAQALIGGRVDATAVSVGTWMTVRSARNVKVLLDHEPYYAAAPVVQKVNAVTVRLLRERPDDLRRFTAAIVKASRHFAENKQVWIDAMARRRSDVDRSILGDLWDVYRTSWAVNGSLNLGEYLKTSDFLYQTSDFKQVPKIHVWDWVDTRFVDAVLKEIGVYSRFDPPGRTIR